MADKYHRFEIDSVSQAQSTQLSADLGTVDTSGLTINGFSWSPDDNQYVIDCGGPTPDTALDNLRTQIQATLGKSPEIDLEVIRDCSQCRTGEDCQAGNRTQLKPIDRVLFGMASGNAVSRKGVTYVANGTILYEQTGPRSQLKAVQFNSANARFHLASPPAWMTPGTKDFAIEFWVKHLNTNPNPQQALFDFSTNGGTTAGVAVWVTETSVRFGIGDGTKFHVSQFQHDGSYWQDGIWHRFGWAAVRSRNKAVFFANDEIHPVDIVGTTTLDEIGDVQPAGAARIGGRSHIAAGDTWVFGGLLAGIQISAL